MAKRKPAAIELPPLPRLNWDADADAWAATVKLPLWAGFFDGRPARRRKMSDGSVSLQVHTPDMEPTPPSAEQAAAYQFLLDDGEAVREAVLKAVFRKYPSWRRRVVRDEMLDAEELAEEMPELASAEGLRELAGVGLVYFHPAALNGRAYVGFAFHCTWDPGHGFGVLTHSKRVVGVSDDSELAWDTAASEQDAERRE